MIFIHLCVRIIEVESQGVTGSDNIFRSNLIKTVQG